MHVRDPEKADELTNNSPRRQVNTSRPSRSNSVQPIIPSLSPVPVVVAPNNHVGSNNVQNNTLAPPTPETPMSNSCRRGTTPFVKSRSIECGMLGSVDRQMKNLMLVNNGEKIVYPSNDRVTINIAGKIFETSLVDLNKFPDTLLGNHDTRKQYYDIFRDEYYFNRNQIAFDSILYFYQSGGDIYQPEGLPDVVFERELEFFQLVDTSLPAHCDSPDLEMTHSQIMSQTVGFERWRSVLWGFVEYPKSSVPARIWATSNIIIIVISVINLIWESIPKYRRDTSIEAFFIVDTVCVSYFTLDLILRIISTPSLSNFLKIVLNWFDFLAIVPFYVELIVGRESASGLAAFRILRLFRITRLFKLIRHSSRMMLMMEVVSNCLSELVMLFLTWVMGTLIFGTIMFYIEESEDSKFKSILHACWWAAVTMTTVGYGDLSPETPLGQSIGSVILFLSMIYIALPMTLIVSKFSSTLAAHQEQMSEKRRKFKKIPNKEHHGFF
ncbi:hypothetical protein ACHWQZ_G013394 [Mnemiopsis leidyi]